MKVIKDLVAFLNIKSIKEKKDNNKVLNLQRRKCEKETGCEIIKDPVKYLGLYLTGCKTYLKTITPMIYYFKDNYSKKDLNIYANTTYLYSRNRLKTLLELLNEE